MNKTFNLKPAQIKRSWVIVDASEAPLGRVAGVIAKQLIGKHKPTYTAHVDNGDYVIVINAAKAIVTGSKETDKKYYRHSGYPSGLTEQTFRDVLAKDPSRIIIAAVRGMLPKNKLSPERLKRLKVYANESHAHEAQQPTKIGVK